MKQENKFVLPEKWYIIVNEENKIKVNNWYGYGDLFLKPNLHICGMAKQYGKVEKGYNEVQNIKNGDGNDSSYDFGIEITFEQFKQHVLKEIPKPEYYPKDVAFKPIGYNFKDQKIKNIVTAFLGSIEAYKTDSYDFPVRSYVYMELKELQVLDLWCDKVLFEKESEFNSSNAFKELKKETDKLLKIVGYKLIKPEYKEAVSKLIDLSLGDFEFTKRYPFNFTSSSDWYFELKEMKVLDLFFEPVYEKEPITLKSGVKLSEDDIAEVKEILNNK